MIQRIVLVSLVAVYAIQTFSFGLAWLGLSTYVPETAADAFFDHGLIATALYLAWRDVR